MGILNRLQLWWNWLTTDPLGFALYLLYFAVSVLLTLILHEIAHGYVAYRCGDPTAEGRQDAGAAVAGPPEASGSHRHALSGVLGLRLGQARAGQSPQF